MTPSSPSSATSPEARSQVADNCIYVDHGESCDVLTEKLRRARKEHTCCECGDAIKPGDLYEDSDGLWDGMWAKHRTCARCVNVRADYFVGWTYTMMVEDFYNAHGFDYRDGIPADFTPCGVA